MLILKKNSTSTTFKHLVESIDLNYNKPRTTSQKMEANKT